MSMKLRGIVPAYNGLPPESQCMLKIFCRFFLDSKTTKPRAIFELPHSTVTRPRPRANAGYKK
ncbi:MAG: hypothetical protein ACI9EP_001410 [Oceanospirillaceae bacterium]|jgi:hypothetical protein